MAEFGSSTPRKAGASNMTAHYAVGVTMGHMARHFEAIVLILSAEYATAVVAMTIPAAVA
jgi:uncharacterized radical SAM superfamily protein